MTDPAPMTPGDDRQIFTQLGELKGLLNGLQAGLGQHRDTVAGFMSRIERLEQRQVQLEAHQVTREDVRSLEDTVRRLAESEARASGSRSFADGLATKAAPWGALLVALLAFINGAQDRNPDQPRAPAATTHQTP
jgi:hypothetical protein